ncbi:MAG TPA: hypothetical protein VFW19_10620 [Allosphingosinicella sp.]|nr:hypothetical protein [Allosphingosinicella sp.]
METIRCKALMPFTEHVPGHGQVHGDPDSSLEKARFPEVPAHVVDKLADRRRVERIGDGEAAAEAPAKPKGKKAAAEAPADAPPAE